MNTLFEQNLEKLAPLAEKLRPKNFDEVIGQDALVDSLRRFSAAQGMISCILWGPPGTGKTTLARIFAQEKDADFIPFSAVSDGVKKIRESAENARKTGRMTILFVDEIHALSKSQQDVLLPYLEKGDFFLIGATTENPSFSLNSALLSRVRVFLTRQISAENLEKILDTTGVKLEESARNFLVNFSNGDARALLSLLEAGILSDDTSAENFAKIAEEKRIRYDRKGEEHFNVISAFIKSMRASDADAAIYYLARMLAGGEDPRFIARRMMIFASEDIGLADKNALPIASAALTATEKIGMPEVRILLGHATAYLARAPKSNASYEAINAALVEVKNSGNLPIPLHLRNAPTNFMKELGYGKDYKYPHHGSKNEENLPREILGKKFLEDNSDKT